VRGSTLRPGAGRSACKYRHQDSAASSQVPANTVSTETDKYDNQASGSIFSMIAGQGDSP